MELRKSGGFISFGWNEGGVGQTLGSLTWPLQGTWGHSLKDREGKSRLMVMCPMWSPKPLLTWMETLKLNSRN